ncbi:MAG: threonine aldolase family protein [Hyphomicrobiales bacterium]
MDFRSDNVFGVSPEIMDALNAANDGSAASYGGDEWTERVEKKLQEIFDCDLAAFPVATGTAANALGLSAICQPYGAIFCHAGSHIYCDECGAPELFTGGAKLIGLSTPGGKFGPGDAERVLGTFVRGEHDPKPSAISISQVTELGTVYSLDEIKDLGAFAKEHNLNMHMDGARFANAVVSLECSPADMTWKRGVDVLSLGATKNGAMAAEAVVFFDTKLAEDFVHRRMRGGHLISKSRFLSAQLEAYFENNLWLENAKHANTMAQATAKALKAVPDVRFCAPVEANEIFPIMRAEHAVELQAAGVQFNRWPATGTTDEGLAEDENIYRFITSFKTSITDIEALANVCQTLSKK